MLCHQRRLWNVGGTYRILGEFLLISSLPGKALRTLVDIVRLAEPGNLISKDANLVFYLSVYLLFLSSN